MDKLVQGFTSLVTGFFILSILIAIGKQLIAFALNKWLGMLVPNGRTPIAWIISVIFALIIAVFALMTVTQYRLGWNIVQGASKAIGLNAYPLKNAGAQMFGYFGKVTDGAENLIDIAKNVTTSDKSNKDNKKPSAPIKNNKNLKKDELKNNTSSQAIIVIKEPVQITSANVWFGIGLGLLSWIVLYYTLYPTIMNANIQIMLKILQGKAISEGHMIVGYWVNVAVFTLINVLIFFLIAKHVVGFDVLKWSPVMVETAQEHIDPAVIKHISKNVDINKRPTKSADQSDQTRKDKQNKQPKQITKQSNKDAELAAAREAEEQLRIFNEQIKRQQNKSNK